jgi:hypothetical protein
MVAYKEQYVVDDKGRKVAVLLDIKEHLLLLEGVEELESIRAYDLAKASGDRAVPFEEAVAEIEQHRSA